VPPLQDTDFILHTALSELKMFHLFRLVFPALANTLLVVI